MIHIVQCLCPDRHCIMAVAYDDAVTDGEEAQRKLQGVIKQAVDAGGDQPVVWHLPIAGFLLRRWRDPLSHHGRGDAGARTGAARPARQPRPYQRS